MKASRVGVGFLETKEAIERKRAKVFFFLVFVPVVSARLKESGLKFLLVVFFKQRGKGEGALLFREDPKCSFFLV